MAGRACIATAPVPAASQQVHPTLACVLRVLRVAHMHAGSNLLAMAMRVVHTKHGLLLGNQCLLLLAAVRMHAARVSSHIL